MTVLWRYINWDERVLTCCLIGIWKIGRYSDAEVRNYKTLRAVNVYPIKVSERWWTHQSRQETLELTFKILCMKTECGHKSTLSCKGSEMPLCYQTYLLSVMTFTTHMGCLGSISPFWISREPVAWPWCNLTASQRSYCTAMYSHSPVGLVSWQWDAADWACVLCDRRIQNGWVSRSASSRQYACPYYSSHAGFFGGVRYRV
jgi:hypothetical protein